MEVNGSYSSWLPVRSGVPQGSVLGPLLFIIYVNDIYSVIHNTRLGMFADDLALYREVRILDDCELLQNDLTNVSWSHRWQLKLNWTKCEAINITNRRHSLLLYMVYITIPFNDALNFAIWILSLILT